MRASLNAQTPPYMKRELHGSLPVLHITIVRRPEISRVTSSQRQCITSFPTNALNARDFTTNHNVPPYVRLTVVCPTQTILKPRSNSLKRRSTWIPSTQEDYGFKPWKSTSSEEKYVRYSPRRWKCLFELNGKHFLFPVHVLCPAL